jgi:hypothetical protein
LRSKAGIITKGFKRALAFAGIVSSMFGNDNPYVQAFWPQKFWGSPTIAPDYLVYGREYFRQAVQMGSSNDNEKRLYLGTKVPELKVTCEQTPTCD